MSNNLKLINTNTINSKPIRNYIKVKNTGGPKGDTGATGATGPQGPQGPAGQAATINIGETTTLLPGQTATVTNTGTQQNATLNFGIPQGLRGPTGAQGPKGDTGPQGLKGDKGNDGAAASVTVGITNTGEPGSNASVTNLGTSSNAILSFTIPTGSRGPQGQTGPQGPKGDTGDKGDAGQAATVEVGSTTTTNPGTSATVTNSGTTSAAVLNFGIPRGAAGSVKSEVVSDLPESGEGDTFYLVNREATTQTATGKAINFTNSENTGDITDAQIDGETSQNGAPTPSAPVPVNTVTGENVVKICGKNLLADSITGSITWQDTTVSFDGDEITINKLSTGAISAGARTNAVSCPLYSGQTYTLSLNYKSGTIVTTGATADWQFLIYGVKSDGTTTSYLANARPDRTSATPSVASASFTPTENLVGYKLGCYIPSAAPNTSGDVIFDCQLELGSTATIYEPYQDQSYEVNFNLEHGKNMLDPSTLVDGYISINGEYNAAHTYDEMRSGMIAVEPNTAYTFSIQATGSTYDPWFGVGEYTSDNVASFVRRDTNSAAGATSITFTTSATTNYITVSARNLKTATKVQLEQGSSATTYEPWSPLELCKIGDYQDYIYKSGDKWYVHKATHKIVLNGTESWSRWTTGQEDTYQTRAFALPTTFYGDNIPIYPQGSAITDLAKSNMVKVRGTAWGDSPSTIALNSTANLGLQYKLEKQYLNYTDSMTSEELVALFKTWLGSHMTSLYYALATPTDTEITNSALIEQLDNLASAALYSGVNNIFTVTPNEVPTLELDYVTYDKYNQNKVYIWNDDLQQWQIIVQ